MPESRFVVLAVKADHHSFAVLYILLLLYLFLIQSQLGLKMLFF